MTYYVTNKCKRFLAIIHFSNLRAHCCLTIVYTISMDTPSSQFNALDEEFDGIAAAMPQQLLDNPSGFDIYNTLTENTFDKIAVNMPQHLLDSNHYYYNNFKGTYNIRHRPTSFEFYIPLGNINQSGSYVGSAQEELLITRIGIKANIKSRIGDTISFKFAVLKGNNPFDEHTQRTVIDDYRKNLTL